MPDVELPLPFSAYVGEQPYVFVAYAHKDALVVFRELRALRERGLRIWYDEGIDPGNEWPEEIAKALSGASVFLVFVSRSAAESQNVRNEINFALNRGKPLLAVYLEDTRLPPGLELRMGDIQAIMKWRMTQEHYSKKIISSFPAAVFEGLRATQDPPAPRPADALPTDSPTVSAPAIVSNATGTNQQKTTARSRNIGIASMIGGLVILGIFAAVLWPNSGNGGNSDSPAADTTLAAAAPVPSPTRDTAPRVTRQTSRERQQYNYELDQPPDSADSAIVRGAVISGDNKTWAHLALQNATTAMQQAMQSRARADYQTALRFAQLSSNLNPTVEAKYITGAAAYSIGLSAYNDAVKSNSCQLAQMARYHWAIVQTAFPLAGDAHSTGVGQVLDDVQHYRPLVAQAVKLFCR